MRNLIETYKPGAERCREHHAQQSHDELCDRREKLERIYITEKVDRETGWQFICLEEEWTQGYFEEIQDFMECVALGREPAPTSAWETTKIIYAGYRSAEEGRRIAL